MASVVQEKKPFIVHEDFVNAVVKHKLLGEKNKQLRGEKFVLITQDYNQGKEEEDQRTVTQVNNYFNKTKGKAVKDTIHNRKEAMKTGGGMCLKCMYCGLLSCAE